MRLYRVSYMFSFADRFREVCRDLGTAGEVVDTSHWQSLSDVPQTRTVELRNVVFEYPLPYEGREPSTQVKALQDQIEPSDPWAEMQFQERISGQPRNPGNTYHLWPYYRGNVPKHQDQEEKFSHTYMERFWPKRANLDDPAMKYGDDRRGIRYGYGDLIDVINLLADHPTTRQAYLPIFFPEDTGAVAGQRIPCTLGYHFMLRENRLHMQYPIRSCDLLRHFRDDVYLAARLCQHVVEELVPRNAGGRRDFKADHPWAKVLPGVLTMHMFSLHAFEPERELLVKMSQR